MELPEDVTRTISWLQAAGFAVVEVLGGPTAPFGDQVQTYGRGGGAQVRIIRDRGQWFMDIQLPGYTDWIDLGLAIKARDGQTEEEYQFEGREPGSPLPDQLPAGVPWLHELPPVIRWIDTDPTASEKLMQAQLWHGKAVRGYFDRIVADRNPLAARRTREEIIRSYYRAQHAKRHPPRQRPDPDTLHSRTESNGS